MRRIRPHTQRAEARLDAVDGIEYRGRYQCDYPASYIRGGAARNDRIVHYSDPLQDRIWSSSRHRYRSRNE